MLSSTSNYQCKRSPSNSVLDPNEWAQMNDWARAMGSNESPRMVPGPGLNEWARSRMNGPNERGPE